MNKISAFMERKIMPIANAFSSNRYLSSVSKGMQALLPVFMVGAIFTLLNGLPNTAYQAFITSNGISDLFSLIPDVTMNCVSIYVTFMITKTLFENFDMQKDATIGGILSIVTFLMMIPKSVDTSGLLAVTQMPMTYLGAQGLFVGIINSFIVLKVYEFAKKKNLVIRLPENIPGNIANMFTAVIPAVLLASLYLIFIQIFKYTPYENIFPCIYKLLQLPLQGLTGNIWSMLLLMFICQILWFFGIHGSMVVLTPVFPAWLAMMMENMSSYAKTGIIPNVFTSAFFDFGAIGGCGSTLGLAFMFMFLSKSKQYRTLGKMFTPTAIFNINEPMVFGLPLMLNPITLIPFILAPLVALLLAYLCICILGIVPAPIGINGLAFVPIFLRGILNGSWKIGVLEIAIFLISTLIYYPFFRILDRKAYAQEQEEINHV